MKDQCKKNNKTKSVIRKTIVSIQYVDLNNLI